MGELGESGELLVENCEEVSESSRVGEVLAEYGARCMEVGV